MATVGDNEKQEAAPVEVQQVDIQQNGDQMLFHSVKYEQIYFQQYLQPQWKDPNHVLPGLIVDSRNKKIILCYLEVFMDIFAIIFLILRQSRVTIIFTVGNLIFLILGIWASLRLNYWGLVAHTTWTLGVVGGFVVYKVIDTVTYMNLDRDPANQDTGQIDRSTVRIISTLPQLFILAIGVYGCILILRLDDEMTARQKYEEEKKAAEDARKQQQDQEQALALEEQSSKAADVQPQDEVQVQILKIDPLNMGHEKCAYCLENEKNILFYPCGHKVLCEACSQKFMQQANHMLCPICRFRIKDMIKVFK